MDDKEFAGLPEHHQARTVGVTFERKRDEARAEHLASEFSDGCEMFEVATCERDFNSGFNACRSVMRGEIDKLKTAVKELGVRCYRYHHERCPYSKGHNILTCNCGASEENNAVNEILEGVK